MQVVTVIRGLPFVNAQKMRERHPETFEAPSYEELTAIKPGDYLKVCLNEERFWTKVVSISRDAIIATVENDLVINNLPCDTLVEFHKHHIFTTHLPE